MKIWTGILSCAAMLALFTGCDSWNFGGSADSWNESQGWVSFSGRYAGGAGKWLVSNYSNMGGTNSGTAVVDLGVTVAGQLTYSGKINLSQFSGALAIVVETTANMTADAAGILSGTGVASGNINWDTGNYTFTLKDPPTPDLAIRATFETSTASQLAPGGSGVVINTFNVEQTGNKLRITDNNGSVYEGTFGSYAILGTNAPLVSTNGIAHTGGQTVVAQFDAHGTSAAGVAVEMTGNFQAQTVQALVVSATPTTNLVVVSQTWSRSVHGTWLEEGGKTGNIDGTADPIVTSQVQ